MNKYSTIAAFGIIGFFQFVNQSQISNEIATRDQAIGILEDRVVDLESHFIGHTVILAKNGKGISIVPCKLNIDKHCHRDDTGITLNDMLIEGWNYGVYAEGNGVKRVPKNESTAHLEITDNNINGIKNVNYSGPNDWHFKLKIFWTGIRQAFAELTDNGVIEGPMTGGKD